MNLQEATKNLKDESFEPIAILEYDRRHRLALPWQFIMAAIFLVDIFASMILLAYQHILLASLVFIFFILLIILAVFLSRYFNAKFKLCCPYCKRSLQDSFQSFKTYIRSKGASYRDFNPFISGKCLNCENHIIQVDQEMNHYLRQRNAQIKANKSFLVSFICFIIGFAAFCMILGISDESSQEDNQEPKYRDIYSARRQIEKGNFLQAKKALTYILMKEPNYSTANELLGYIYLQENEFENALRFYRKALPYSVETDEIDSAIMLIQQRMTNEE